MIKIPTSNKYIEGDVMSYSNTKVCYSINGLIEHAKAKQGRLTLSVSNNFLDLNWFPNGSNNLLIFFSASVARTQKTVLPVFSGTGAIGKVNANILMIADPSLHLSDDLTLAWYSGNENNDLQGLLGNTLKIFSDYFGKNRTILYGGSSGGFASIYYSTYIPGSLPVAVNPQTDISKYYKKFSVKYLTTCFPDILVDNDIEKGFLSTGIDYDVIPRFTQSYNKLIYLQNESDDHHIKNHLEPFLRKQGLKDINQKENVFPISERILLVKGKEWGEGHKPPPKKFIFYLLQLLINEEDNLCSKVKELYINLII